ncbi:aromatic ring-hydroxylating dioxygenase subunit alpha [Paraburkholderia sp. 22B1P]|uniref:aromatic ring-hydroxylating dioxygenase subunit alpha n=1 Tax=Paraburkholderia sp. 22B1P TaxID=3080498 RepID=UPI003092A37B|nr:aromatic ring-hydroxylating dioxygenase subunit alpha [Paraburkholderia sp. 22B1P]
MSSISIPITAQTGCQDPVLLNEWHVVGYVTDFVSGELYPVRLLDRELVVWRDEEGTLHIWEDLCIHRGAKLSKGKICNGEVVCPYHGWRYDRDAKCTLIPSAPDEAPMKKARAFPYHVEERYGFAWVCLGVPAREIPAFPEWEQPDYLKVHCGPYEFAANGFRAIENFLDISHFPFVHSGMNGVPDAPDVLPPYSVELTDTGLISSEIRVFQPFGDARGRPVISNYTFCSLRPLVAHFVKRTIDADESGMPLTDDQNFFATLCTAQPVSETRCILRVCAALSVKPAPPPQSVQQRADIIFNQDKEIVETQRPERIPSELRYELHHRSDLMGQKYRAWLRSMDITYGVI